MSNPPKYTPAQLKAIAEQRRLAEIEKAESSAIDDAKKRDKGFAEMMAYSDFMGNDSKSLARAYAGDGKPAPKDTVFKLNGKDARSYLVDNVPEDPVWKKKDVSMKDWPYKDNVPIVGGELPYENRMRYNAESIGAKPIGSDYVGAVSPPIRVDSIPSFISKKSSSGMYVDTLLSNQLQAEVDQEYLRLKNTKGLKIQKVWDGDTVIDAFGNFHRIANYDAPDTNKEGGREALTKMLSLKPTARLVPTGQVDSYNRPISDIVDINKDGSLWKADSAMIASGNAGVLNYNPSVQKDKNLSIAQKIADRVNVSGNQRMLRIQKMYESTNKITLDNAFEKEKYKRNKNK